MANTRPKQQIIDLPFQIPSEFVERFTEYWHRHRFPSRSAAIRFLLAYGMEHDISPKGAAEETRSKGMKRETET